MSNIILSIYPNTKGFGYVVFANQKELLDYGVAQVRPLRNRSIRKRIQRFLEFYEPAIILMQDPDDESTRQGNRIKDLIELIQEDAKKQNLSVKKYSRDAVMNVFDQFGAKTKHEIAILLTKWFPQLKSKAPKPRKLWESEWYMMGMFEAISVYITYIFLSE